MENTGQNGYKNPRMDRMEGMMELLIVDHMKFADEHNKLLTAQVVLTDRVDKLAVSILELRESQKATDEQMKITDEQMKATDARLSILIGVMDNFIAERRNRQ